MRYHCSTFRASVLTEQFSAKKATCAASAGLRRCTCSLQLARQVDRATTAQHSVGSCCKQPRTQLRRDERIDCAACCAIKQQQQIGAAL